MQKNSIIAVIVVLVLLVVLGFGLSAYFGSQKAVMPGHLDTFTAEAPNLVATGSGLSNVEIWTIPTGTGMTEESYTKIGDATLTNTGTTDSSQRWVFQIPREPLLISGIFAKGLDAAGKEIGRVSLSTVGATSLHDLLWAGTGPKQSTAGIGGVVTSSDGKLLITPTKVTEDSRCPNGVQCIQAGRVVLTVQASNDGATSTVSLSTDKTVTIGRYFVTLVSVLPAKEKDKKIGAADYTFTISIAEDTKG